MRLIDAAIKDLEMIGDCRTCGNKTPFCDSNPDGCSGYKWRGVPFAATDDSRPLTMEELREMDGEAVWVVELNGYPPRWGLVYWYRKNKRNIVYVTINNGASIDAEKFMAAGGKIYRRKPEEGTSVGS